MNGIMKGINSEEVLTCLIFVAIGYFIAKMFSRCSGNGFSIGGQPIRCSEADDGGWLGKRSEAQCYFTGLNLSNEEKKDLGWLDSGGEPCCMLGMDNDNSGRGACGYKARLGNDIECRQDRSLFNTGLGSDFDGNENCTYVWNPSTGHIQCDD